MIDKKPIYFNEALHKYTDEFSNEFISVTTLLGKYEEKFSDKQVDIAKACEKIGRNPRHPKFNKYKGKTWKQLLVEWKATSEKACEIGNKKHNYLETSVKDSSNFNVVFKSRYSDKGTVRLYTIEDILEEHSFGQLDLNYFIKAGVKDKYPKIYNIIEYFVNQGFRIYSEIAVFDFNFMISGLVDILFVKDNVFYILDWKTNKNKIVFEAGYWDNDKHGSAIKYIYTDKKFKYPINHLDYSVGNKYTLQLSLYARLIELFGLQFGGLILCHILHKAYDLNHKDVLEHPDWVGKNEVRAMNINYYRNEVNAILGDYSKNKNTGQMKILS